jgi:hypothetical protein
LETLRLAFSAKLEKLIAKFEADREHYLSKAYPEAQARVDFITPFFKALGWDVENEAGLPHHQREVVVEKGEAETEGRPDYNFRLGGQTKFFVEAKAPSEPLDSARHILQAKGYAWNTKQVFFVILTDFEEFRFYDASIKPDERKPDEGLLLTLKYTDYLKNVEKLWEFSKDRVAAGSLDAMLPRDRRTQRLRIPVDEAFLDEMTGWREDLARNVFKNNPDLTAKQLNEVVQRLLDRIVFIRIAEDRRIIEKNQLREAVEEWEARGGKFHLFDWLNDLFHRINEDFNGEIFKPHLSESIKIDSDVLARIIERLYPPQSPYRFDVIGVELLGSICERYLGKTIRPTAKTVRVEEKPEVRKAGGVYYTPKYIVDYIVKNTVGKVLEGKTPKQIEKIRILDPACGSGSFLIGAFQYLIDYHVRYLTAHPKEAHIHPLFPDLIRDGNPSADGPRLSVRLKARILRHNLFGVDIDPQAVEITMMSLYLKALEGEKSQLPPKQSLLPELKYNIICGNSLIGPDIYDQGTLFADDERDRINAFDWYALPPAVAPLYERRPLKDNEKPAVIDRRYSDASDILGFGRIMKQGGFDCVIGNPPYVRQEMIGAFKAYFQSHYASYQGTADLYVFFIEKGIRLLRENGLFGFIVANKWMRADYGDRLRKWLMKRRLVEVIDFGDLPVFSKATIYPCILVVQNALPKNSFLVTRVETLDFADLADYVGSKSFSVEHSGRGETGWSFLGDRQRTLLERLRAASLTLREHVGGNVYYGIKTGFNKAFVIDRSTRRRLITESPNSSELIRPFLVGKDIKRYQPPQAKRYVLFTRRGVDIHEYPAIHAYLHRFKDRLMPRPKSWHGGRWRGRKPGPYHWYEIQDTVAYYREFEKPKIIWPGISAEVTAFALDERGHYGNDNTQMIVSNDKYLLGILNSCLARFFLLSVCDKVQGGFYRLKITYVEQLPIRPINFSDRADKARHDKMVALVQRMLELNKRWGGSRTAQGASRRAPAAVAAMSPSPSVGGEDAAATDLDRDIAATDEQIDNLVYELYGITEEEQKIIENT